MDAEDRLRAKSNKVVDVLARVAVVNMSVGFVLMLAEVRSLGTALWGFGSVALILYAILLFWESGDGR